jgi:hypothetical protein
MVTDSVGVLETVEICIAETAAVLEVEAVPLTCGSWLPMPAPESACWEPKGEPRGDCVGVAVRLSVGAAASCRIIRPWLKASEPLPPGNWLVGAT